MLAASQQRELRKRSVDMLKKALTDDKSLIEESYLSGIATRIEDAIWTYLDLSSYKDRIRALFLNIRSNPKLKDMLLTDTTLDHKRLASVPVEKLATAERRREDERMFEELIQWEIGQDREDVKPRPTPEVRRDMVED